MLKLYNIYSRSDAQEIFEPDYRFEPSRGTWGLHGVIRLPNKQNDWVFFVTYGQTQAGHEFDEGITPDGVLTWQSQPSQGFDNERIQKWITHDQSIDQIHLFVRSNKKANYFYMGLLQYIEHDAERERPVWFQFQIQDFDPPEKIYKQIKGNALAISYLDSTKKIFKPTKHEAPRLQTKSVTTRTFNAVKIPDLSGREASNKRLGLAGELFVLEVEKQNLIEKGLSQLADRVEHVSQTKGDGAGYDIRSFNLHGEDRFIEVKTTQGGIKSNFFVTPNELEFGKFNANKYVLIRVFNFCLEVGKGDYFELIGDPSSHVNLTATNYRASF
ncbi:DUF3427 domain-containing protein [Rhodobacteraceae bacterium nBUS_24]